MAARPVTHVRRDLRGNTIGLGNPGQPWSVTSADAAIREIDLRINSYYVSWPEKMTSIDVVDGPSGKYLRTDRDNTTRNNLDDLPGI